MNYLIYPGLSIESRCKIVRNESEPVKLLNRALTVIENLYQVDRETVLSKKRDAPLPMLRYYIMNLLRSRYRLSYRNIGELVGGRDHATVIHGIDKLMNITDVYESEAKEYNRFLNML